MRILGKIILIFALILLVGYLLLTQTTYLDFVKNWPVIGDEVCCINDETTNWKTYISDKYGFEIKYPSNYDLNTEVTGSLLISHKIPAELSFSIEDNPRLLPIKEWVKSDLVIHDLSIKWDTIKINNIESLKSETGGNMDGGIGYGVIIPRNDKVYMMMFSTKAPNTESELAVFDKIISIFKFTKTSQNQSTDLQNMETANDSEASSSLSAVNVELKCPDEKSFSGFGFNPLNKKVEFNCDIDDQRRVILSAVAGTDKNYEVFVLKGAEGNDLGQSKVGTGPIYDSQGKFLYYKIKVTGRIIDISYPYGATSGEIKGWLVDTRNFASSPYTVNR